MKTLDNSIDILSQAFDKELRAILRADLKKFKAEKGKFLSNNQANTENKSLLVA